MGFYHPNRNRQKQNANNGPLLPDQKQTEEETDLSLWKQNVELGVH